MPVTGEGSYLPKVSTDGDHVDNFTTVWIWVLLNPVNLVLVSYQEEDL